MALLEIECETQDEMLQLAPQLEKRGASCARAMSGASVIVVHQLSGMGVCPSADEIKEFAKTWLSGYREGLERGKTSR